MVGDLMWIFLLLAVPSFEQTVTSQPDMSSDQPVTVLEPSTVDPETGLPDSLSYTPELLTDAPVIATVELGPWSRRLSFPVLELFNISQEAANDFDRFSGMFFLDLFVSKVTCLGAHCDKTCTCDSDCFTYRRCCIDYLWNETNPMPLVEYLDMFVKTSKRYVELECKPLLQYIPGHFAEVIWMVASCPETALASTSELCYSIGPANDINVPVIGDDGKVYRNQYCAICNSISQYEYLNISVMCENAANMTDPGKSFSNFLKCTFKADPPSAYPKAIQPCERVYKRECDGSNPYYDLCRAYVGESSSRLRDFTNVHCLWCNNESLDFHISYYCYKTIISTLLLPYSFVISFTSGTQYSYRNKGPRYTNPDGTESENEGSKSLCPPGETYEIGRARCRPFSCGFGYAVSGSACVKVAPLPKPPIQVTNSSFDACLQSRGGYLSFGFRERNSSLQAVGKLKEYLAKLFGEPDTTAMSLSSDGSHFLAFYLHRLGSSEYGSVIRNMSRASDDVWALNDILGIYISSERVSFTELYGPDFSRHFSAGICADSTRLSESEFQVNLNCTVRARSSSNNNNYTNNTNNDSALFDDAALAFLVELRPGSMSKAVFICSKFHLSSSCPLQVLPLSNITIINGTTSVIANNKTYNYPDYQPLAVGVGVCINTARAIRRHLPSWMKTADKVEYYLTMIGIPVSMFCYVWIILTFTLIRELRNIPGYNLVALCSSLLLSDIVFLTIIQVKQSSSSCKGLAILFHWLLLLVQAWTGVTAFEMARRFSSSLPMAGGTTRRFALYSSVSLVASTAIVVAMIAVDETSHHVGYGQGGWCWIYYFNARFFGYILIVIVVTALSAFLLSFALIKIFRRYRDLRDALKDSNRKDINVLKIALKLVVLVGIVEIVGLVQITSPDSEWEHVINATFRICYTFLRSFRGVLMWMMYIASKVILKHYRSKAGNWSSAIVGTRKTSASNGLDTSMTELRKPSNPGTPYSVRV